MDKTLKARANGGARKRPNFPTEFKRHLVEQTFAPAASVALIARRHDINANLLFKWRRQYRKGAYGVPTLAEHGAAASAGTTPPLLPVSVIADTPATLPTEAPVPSADPVCEIAFERARVLIRGDVSPTLLQLVLREQPFRQSRRAKVQLRKKPRLSLRSSGKPCSSRTCCSDTQDFHHGYRTTTPSRSVGMQGHLWCCRPFHSPQR